MIHELASNPMFGLILSISMYLLAVKIAKKYPFPLFNPLILAIIFVIAILKITNISYDDYFQGGSILNILITPATVALAIPLYNSLHLLKRHARSIMIGIIAGSLISTLLTVVLGVLFKLDKELMASIIPKSVTTAIAIEISDKMGGVPTVTLVVVLVTGVLGSVVGPYVLKWFKIEDSVAKGIALGSSAHAIGTAKAMEMGQVEGAMSGLAIGVTGVVTVFLAPMILEIVCKFLF